MKIISETKALEDLHRLKSDFRRSIRHDYEHAATDCMTCATPGACCLDAHFVNVHITRLESVTIRNVIDELPAERQTAIFDRVEDTIARYGLSSERDTFTQTYACPLFEKGIGCLVHERGKPLPCIAHACYENKNDLPPDELLAEHEGHVERLNEAAYRRPATWLPLPIAIRKLSASDRSVSFDRRGWSVGAAGREK